MNIDWNEKLKSYFHTLTHMGYLNQRIVDDYIILFYIYDLITDPNISKQLHEEEMCIIDELLNCIDV